MRYAAIIRITEDIDQVHKLLVSEESRLDRSCLELKKTEDALEIMVKAGDSVALRATLNGITQLLTIYENMRDIP